MSVHLQKQLKLITFEERNIVVARSLDAIDLKTAELFLANTPRGSTNDISSLLSITFFFNYAFFPLNPPLKHAFSSVRYSVNSGPFGFDLAGMGHFL